jgi:hypothetical protein
MSFQSSLAVFQALFRRQANSEAMRQWDSLRDNYPAELIAWLDTQPGFFPPYGVHIGEPGSEPWRPLKPCAVCGTEHRYGSEAYLNHIQR